MWNKFYFGLNYCLLSRSSYHQDDGYNLRDLRDKINATIAHSEHSMNNDPESRFELQTKVNRSRSEQRNRFVFLISRHIFILTIQDLLRVTQVSRPWVGPQSVRRDTFPESSSSLNPAVHTHIYVPPEPVINYLVSALNKCNLVYF